MSREIKFRVWDGDVKHMLDHEDLISFMDDGTTILQDVFTGMFNSYTLMQFTGLTDKNGKEIYEGDIVSCYDTCGFDNVPQSPMGAVAFNGGCFCVKAKDGYHNKLALTCAEVVEVIGNIHDNPELLEE